MVVKPAAPPDHIGRKTVIELFAHLPRDQQFSEQFTLIRSMPCLIRSMPCPASLLSPPEAVTLGTPALAKQNHAKVLPLQSEAFDRQRYNAAASVQDDIVFGRIACGEVDATARGCRGSSEGDRRFASAPDQYRSGPRLWYGGCANS